jgi:hypothetical protein
MGSSFGEPFSVSIIHLAQYLLVITLGTQSVIRWNKAMRRIQLQSDAASFRPRELREYGEPVLRRSIQLEVRLTFWQRLQRAFGL